jgi:glutathione synthase/RimK-type ligase-like ATP-grasp enzyme
MAARYTIVVDRVGDWKWPEDGLNLVSADSFMTKGGSDTNRVIVLCRRYAYLSAGYYCCLLAEARDQFSMPTVRDVLSLSRKSLVTVAVPELEEVLQRTMARLTNQPDQPFVLHIMFGQPDDTRFRRFSAECFDIFRYPILRVTMAKSKPKTWSITEIQPLGLHQVPEHLGTRFYEALRTYVRARKPSGPGFQPPLYTLGILHDPAEKLPPSDTDALEKFRRIGEDMRIDVELITKNDYERIPEFDALFIRATTAIDHYTYRFARKAELEGLAVIDDTQSILRCANKVFLSEVLKRHKLPTPKSETINRNTFKEGDIRGLEERLGYPMVLKIPDGSFSRGTLKAENRQQLVAHAQLLLKSSRLILAQEFVYTKFDWRVGVLRGEPIFVCQYLMTRNHWQVVRYREDGSFKEGGHKSMPIEAAPREVVETAVQAASFIGNGLYGVDLKQTADGRVLVIEINDNPNIDHGVEDHVPQDGLYKRILADFIRRIDEAV